MDSLLATGTRSTEAIVLAGSYQWTASTFDRLRPRPLLPVAESPLIEFVLDWLKSGGLERAVICGNGSTEVLRSQLEAEPHMTEKHRRPKLSFHEDRSPRGAAGCVKDAAGLSDAPTLLVADGTSIPAFDLSELLRHHRVSGADLTIVAQRDSLHPAGIYVFERRVLDAVPATSFQDIKETLIPRLYRSGRKIEVFRVETVSPRVLNASTYVALNHWMVRRMVSEPHPTAWISPDAVVLGPVVFGEGVRVHAGATIVGPSSVGAGSVVEADAIVARSVIWKDCTIRSRAMVDHCILADGVDVEAASVVSNAIRTRPPSRPADRAARGFDAEFAGLPTRFRQRVTELRTACLPRTFRV